VRQKFLRARLLGVVVFSRKKVALHVTLSFTDCGEDIPERGEWCRQWSASMRTAKEARALQSKESPAHTPGKWKV
jgi:hypothetical protein